MTVLVFTFDADRSTRMRPRPRSMSRIPKVKAHDAGRAVRAPALLSIAAPSTPPRARGSSDPAEDMRCAAPTG
jgi:hypothetical protein